MESLIKKTTSFNVMEQKEFILNEGERLEYLTFSSLNKIKTIKHLFSTRIGGVSTKELSTMNLSFTRGDRVENVKENYQRIAKVLEVNIEDFILSMQTHTTNILTVAHKEKGMGITKERSYEDVDGLITNQRGLVLVCFFADCVPIYFVDEKKEVIGLAHAGWRGTVDGIAEKMIEKMCREFHSNVEDIQVAIGPSICRDCYEVSEEVANIFERKIEEIDNIEKYKKEINVIYGNTEVLVRGKEKGKFQLDLWLSNALLLRNKGILVENLSITDVCTCCNSTYLFSHRASNGQRGNLAAFLSLKN